MNREQIIDFVITWVDSADEAWLEEKKQYTPTIYMDSSNIRYRDFGTLKYVLRSIDKFAPWVRHIFLVTSGQVPQWLILDNPKLKLVKHSDFIPNEYLPTFNPQTIEWHLHKIEGLSENFVYFNDDVILTDYVQPSDFFKNNLPCDSFGLGLVRPREHFSRIAFNNICILNKHFNFKETLKRHRGKFFKFKYKNRLLKTCILSRLDNFHGMYDPHITLVFKKSYFEILWNKERELIEETCKNKFRSQNDITIWLVRYWQLLEGKFVPRSINFGRCYTLDFFIEIKKKTKLLKKSKTKVVCINDSYNLKYENEEIKNQLITTLNSILPIKSSFEE